MPTVFAADLLSPIIYPHCGDSYLHSIPVNTEAPITIPMIEIIDYEKPEGRTLHLHLNTCLCNIKPVFFMHLYNWVCDPIWATAELPESSNWPLKVGNYGITFHDSILMVMNSSRSTNSDDFINISFHSIYTGLQTSCLGCQLDGQLSCNTNAVTNTMECLIEPTISNIFLSKVESLYSKATQTPTNIQFCLQYKCMPITPGSDSYTTTISMDLHHSVLLFSICDLSNTIDIISSHIHQFIDLLSTSNNQKIKSGDNLV